MTRSQEAHQVAEAERYDAKVFLESLKIILKWHTFINIPLLQSTVEQGSFC